MVGIANGVCIAIFALFASLYTGEASEAGSEGACACGRGRGRARARVRARVRARARGRLREYVARGCVRMGGRVYIQYLRGAATAAAAAATTTIAAATAASTPSRKLARMRY